MSGSYLFSGFAIIMQKMETKCFSGERDVNKQIVSLKPDGTAILEMKNTVSGAEPGEYKIKVKIKKDQQKTDYEPAIGGFEQDCHRHSRIASSYHR